MLDFALLTPEINSGLMYSGSGSGPMLAAAAAWGGLATELHFTAASYQSVIAGLIGGPWQGPSSVSMAAAAALQVAWLHGSATQAEEAAAKAAAAASAYEAAFMAHVPPPAIAANRSLLMALVATNFLGQNTPAIMATEALYLEMWAQDAAAMFGYAGASASASTLTSWTPAPLATTGAALGPITAIPQLLSAVPTALQSLSTGSTWQISGPVSDSGLSGVLGFLGMGTPTTVMQALTEFGLPTSFSSGLSQVNQLSGLMANSINGTSLSGWSSLANAMAPKAAAAAAAPALSNVPGLGGLGGAAPVAAGLGRAGSIGGLSVPRAWGEAVPAAGPAATPSQLGGLNAAPGAGSPASSMLGGLPLAAAGGRGTSIGGAPRYGFRLTVVPRPPAAG